MSSRGWHLLTALQYPNPLAAGALYSAPRLFTIVIVYIRPSPPPLPQTTSPVLCLRRRLNQRVFTRLTQRCIYH